MAKKVALVLSAGGARGYAHIGVIEEILNHGFEISSVTGTSIGALIGGMYALGKLHELHKWLKQLTYKDVLAIHDFSLSASHLIKGEKIINKLNEIAPDQKIETLSIPFRAIATDLENEKEIVFDRGSIYSAIRASISIPTFLSPLQTKSMLLVDGGLVNALPLNRIPDDGHDLVIAVNLCAPDDEVIIRRKHKVQNKKKNWINKVLPNPIPHHNYYSLIVNSFKVVIQKNALLSAKLYAPDLMIDIPMNRFSGFDYDKAERIIHYGKRAAQEAIQKFENQ